MVRYRVVNVIPADASSESNDDFQPCLAVDPGLPSAMVVTAYSPAQSSARGSAPYFLSEDGGENWQALSNIPRRGSHNQTCVFVGSAATRGAGPAGALYVAMVPDDQNSSELVVYRFQTATAQGSRVYYLQSGADQPWVDGVTVASGPDAGKERLYVGYNLLGDVAEGRTARLAVCLDAHPSGNAPPVFSTIVLDRHAPSPADDTPVRTAIHGGVGHIFVAFKSLISYDPDTQRSRASLIVVRDDNWGQGSTEVGPFEALKDSATVPGVVVSSVDLLNRGNTLLGVRSSCDLSIAVDPRGGANAARVVYVAWTSNDDAANPSRYVLHVSRSTDAGVTWTLILSVTDATLPSMAVNAAGVVGLLYQKVVAGSSPVETHFQRFAGTSWDDRVLARTAAPTNFASDLSRVVGVGANFYGCFPAMNSPDPDGHYFLPGGGGAVRFQRPASVDPFFFAVEES